MFQKTMGWVLSMALLFGGVISAKADELIDPLAFDPDHFTEETITVNASDGAHEVTYRLYSHICYVADPVDADYQSMDIKVPVMVDGIAVDASDAPILFKNSVGGYMSASNAQASGGKGGGRPNRGTPPEGMTLPEGMALPDGAQRPDRGEMGGRMNDAGGISANTELALAAGYVVVLPGCRGRDNQAEDGTYYGKAPAAIVDLKAAVRYLRYNDAVMPGNAEKIISTGVSAGGALSALLGASGDSDLYDTYLAELGAADASDAIYASAAFCPITDLEHADMAYEWMFSATPYNGASVDEALSATYKEAFESYQESLGLVGRYDFGLLVSENYSEYLVEQYLEPALNKFLSALDEQARASYLESNTWITWQDGKATMAFSDYVTRMNRKKGLPSFDAYDLSAAENDLFGDAQTAARHFTFAGGNAELDAELTDLVRLMNPMQFIGHNESCATYWWIRHGTQDSDTSLPIVVNLATALENSGKNVDAALYWDAGHGADEDPEAFIAWIGEITGSNQ